MFLTAGQREAVDRPPQDGFRPIESTESDVRDPQVHKARPVVGGIGTEQSPVDRGGPAEHVRGLGERLPRDQQSAEVRRANRRVAARGSGRLLEGGRPPPLQRLGLVESAPVDVVDRRLVQASGRRQMLLPEARPDDPARPLQEGLHLGETTEPAVHVREIAENQRRVRVCRPARSFPALEQLPQPGSASVNAFLPRSRSASCSSDDTARGWSGGRVSAACNFRRHRASASVGRPCWSHRLAASRDAATRRSPQAVHAGPSRCSVWLTDPRPGGMPAKRQGPSPIGVCRRGGHGDRKRLPPALTLSRRQV